MTKFLGELPPKNAGCNEAFDHGSDIYLKVASLIRWNLFLEEFRWFRQGIFNYNE